MFLVVVRQLIGLRQSLECSWWSLGVFLVVDMVFLVIVRQLIGLRQSLGCSWWSLGCSWW